MTLLILVTIFVLLPFSILAVVLSNGKPDDRNQT